MMQVEIRMEATLRLHTACALRVSGYFNSSVRSDADGDSE